MALSLTYDPQLSRVRISADGLGSVVPVRVERSTDQVRWSTVRGGYEVLPVAGVAQVDDYEFTPDVPNYYRVVGPTAWDEFARPPLNANPFFETSASSWTALGGTVARSTAQAHEGAASLLLTPDGVAASAEARSENVPITAGTTYRASSWVRSAVARDVVVGIIWRDGGGAFLSSSATTVAVAANTWTLITHDATAPVGAAQAMMQGAALSGTPPASNTVYVDEATLRPFGFGTAPSGQPWQHFGSASAFVAANGVGQHIHSATNQGRISVIDVGSDARVRVTSSVPAVAQPAGTSLSVYAIARFVDDANFYQARLAYIPDLNITCSIRRRAAGVDTTLASIVLPGITHVPNTRYVVELDVAGSLLRGRGWREGDTPPSDWQVEATDTTLTAGTKAGIRTIIDAGSTNTMPFTYTLDDFAVASPETTVFTGSITPSLGGLVWLKSIARPFLNRPVTVADYSDVERPARNGVFDVVGRSLPVSVSDVRGSRRWTLEVLTGTPGDADDLDLMLASGDVLFVHAPAGTGVPEGYVVVGDTRQRRTSRLGPRRVFELPCVEVAAPGPDVVGSTVTCQTVLNTYPTCQAVLDAHDTILSLMDLVGSPEDVIVP